MLDAVAGVLLVALATSLGWGLRGEWGHWWGATVPGAFCGMSIWLASGLSPNAWQMIVYGATLAVSLSLGGTLSYGIIVGYVKGEHDRPPAFGVFGLFLVGGLWGFFGGTGLGLLLTDSSYDLVALALWALLAALGAYLSYKLLVLGLDLHLSPPRSDAWAAVLGGAVATTLFFTLVREDPVVLRTALLGWLGFGGGFSVGGLIHRYFALRGSGVDSWKFMEHSVGFWGGLSLGVAALSIGEPVPAIQAPAAALMAAALVLFWLVPYMNITNNFEHWLRQGWVSRRAFAVYQFVALAIFVLVVYVLQDPVENWEGTPGSRTIYLGMISFLTFMAIAKFKFSTDRARLLVDITFIGMALACAVLVSLL
jgi:hypothetical protein